MHSQTSSLQTSVASIILPIFLLHLSLLSYSLSSLLCSSDLIQKTCNSTTYYDFCISSLSSSPQVTPDITTIKALSTIIINLAISNATDTSSFISSLSKSTTNRSLSSLLCTCAEKYAHAREAPQSSLVAMEDEGYDYAFMHVSATAEYPNVCRVLFRRSGVKLCSRWRWGGGRRCWRGCVLLLWTLFRSLVASILFYFDSRG